MSKSGDDNPKTPTHRAEDAQVRAIRNEDKIIQLRRKDHESLHKQRNAAEAAPNDFDPDPTAA
ncbi:MAG: hypothetical protein WD942_02675 [Dehalococcoidia bacterium]